jgi:amino acid permease
MKKLSSFLYGVSLLSGTIIGVGFFALPYITLKVGFWTILFYFLILGSLILLIHLFFGELALETPDLKRLPGFAKLYLGKRGEKMAFVASIFGIFGSLLAYLIVGGEFLKEIFAPIFGGGDLIWTLVYFILGSILVFFDVKAITKVEFFSVIGFFLVLILLFLGAKDLIKTQNLFLGRVLPSNFFLPYGPILFSLWGASLIPETEEVLSENKRLLKKVISVSILIAILIYLFFIYLILGTCGNSTTKSALLCIKDFWGEKISLLTLFFGFLTTFTSFIALGLTLKKVFWYDLKMPKNLACGISCFVPLILFLLGFKDFISIISFIGAVMLGFEGILILMMYQKYLKSQISNLKFQKLKLKISLVYFLFLVLALGVFGKIISLISK